MRTKTPTLSTPMNVLCAVNVDVVANIINNWVSEPIASAMFLEMGQHLHTLNPGFDLNEWLHKRTKMRTPTTAPEGAG